MDEQSHPVALSIDDPERTLNRLTTFFPIIVAIPILVVISTVSGKGGPFTRDGGRGGPSSPGRVGSRSSAPC